MVFNPNRFTPHLKPEKTPPKQKKGLNKMKEPTGEREVFNSILKSRGNRSQIINPQTGKGDVIWNPRPINFIHVLAKGQNKYPKFKLYEKNIILGTDEQHFEYDNGSHEELRKLPEWEWVFELRDELIEEYKKLI